MAGHEWEDWFEREELIGQISDIRVQNLQVEREVVQKRTFTRWMNLHLEKCNPPMEVHDLFRDIQDGRVLMALLEELSGCKLLHGFKPSSHRIFRLNNIAKVLTFLEERNVKLVSIDAADVADGNSSIVLGLIWNIILFFQIKELTGNIKSQFPSSSSLSSIPTSSDSDTSYSSTPSEERRPSSAARDHGKAIKTLLQWVQRRTRKYGVAVQDFGKSWTSGLAFLAVIKSIDTSLVDMRRALLRSPRENIEDAFRTAHYSLGIPRLLEPEDVTVHPDEQSIMIYVSQFLEHFPGMDEEEVTERSKNSSRLNDPMVRNGVQRKREKSYVVRRDWVQPPPKIFISTVSDDQGPPVSSPVLSQTPEDRPWASDGSSVASSPSPADDRSLSQSLDLNKDVSFTVSSSSSPQPSFVDSVIDSPDSWDEMPSEVAPLDKLQQSQSDDSLNETNVVGDMKSSHSASEGKHDQELSGDLKRTSQEQTDTELFIDEGNFSISSVESLQAKSTAFPGEGGVHRDVFDVNEEGSASKVPNQENVMTSSMPNSETVMEASNDISHVDSDSGYFPDQRETSPASFTENLSRSQEQEAAFENKVDSNFECHAKPLGSSSYLQNSDSVQNDPAEISDKPGETTGAIKDEVTSECPVQDEKVPPFGSVDDTMPVCTALSESEAQNVKHVLNAHVEPKGNETHEDAHVPQTHLEEREEKDKTALFDCQQQKPGPEPEQRFTHLEASEKQASAEPDFNQRLLHHKELDSQDKETSSQTKEVDSTAETEESNMYGGLDMKDVKNSTPDDAAELGMIKPEVPPEPAKADLEDLNLKQTSEPAQFNEGMLANGDTAIPLTEHKLEDRINGTYSLSEHEPRGLQSMTDTESSWTESKSEDVPDGTDHKSRDEHRGTECETKGEDSCNVNNDNEPNDSQSQAADRKEQGEANTNMNVSVIPLDMVYYPHYDVPISKAIEADVKPNPDPALCPDGELRPASPQLHSPKDSMEQRADGPNEGQTTAEEISPEEPEENPTELRLSLSVTPLQPAPTQHSLPDYESDTEETLPRHSEDITLGKSAEDSPELRVQSTGETHTSVEHSELDKTDEGPVAARENMETVREETVHVNAEDERQFPSVRKCTNCKTTIVRKSQNTNTDERKETKTPSQESPPEMLMDEMYLLLMAWLLLYCLFVLPQMEIQTLPHFLLNLDE